MEVFIGIVILLCIASVIMLAQLLIFHIMLREFRKPIILSSRNSMSMYSHIYPDRRGISTYDYIQKKREKTENKTNQIASANAGLEEGADDTNAVACASSADFIDTTVIEKEEGDISSVKNTNDPAKIKKYDAFSNGVSVDHSKQEIVDSTAQSQTFTNEAFTNDEMRNFNMNSNLDPKTLRPLSVHSDVSNNSSLGELKTWDGSEMPITVSQTQLLSGCGFQILYFRSILI